MCVCVRVCNGVCMQMMTNQSNVYRQLRCTRFQQFLISHTSFTECYVRYQLNIFKSNSSKVPLNYCHHFNRNLMQRFWSVRYQNQKSQ